jgi:hypothetical protein
MRHSHCFVKCMCGRICGLWETAVSKELPKGLPGLGAKILPHARGRSPPYFFPKHSPARPSRFLPAHARSSFAVRSFTTLFSLGTGAGLAQYCAHDSISLRRFSSNSPRLYAAST